MTEWKPPDDPRHIISHVLNNHCDKLHPEQARLIIKELKERSYWIIKIRNGVRKPLVIEDDPE